ncbi:hypothetical protein FKW77_004364 [Venturia effusa]|uniref:Uncharacterized protein n=1 Tax=Venturia effusa TaxID=50376 RepID=A0A517L5A0_9PEZI|nr:hypothetical protein FKW77_004364 [Venturia effusa]
MDETTCNNEPQASGQPPSMQHTALTWLLTCTFFILELYQFQKRSFLATLAILDLGLIIYFHWPSGDVERYTAMEYKIPLRILTFILCLAVFIQLLPYFRRFACFVGILIFLILIYHPKHTLVDTPAETRPNVSTANLCPGYISVPSSHRRDLEKGDYIIFSPEPQQESYGLSAPSPSDIPEPQYNFDPNLIDAQSEPPNIVGYMKTALGKRSGRMQPPPIKETSFKLTRRPFAERRISPSEVGTLKSTVRTLVDQNHTLRSENQALQAESAQKIHYSQEDLQREVDQAVAKALEQVVAGNHVIPKSDPKASVAFVGNFCYDNGLDLFRADGSPLPDLHQVVQGLSTPQASQGSGHENSSGSGYGESGGPNSYPGRVSNGTLGHTSGTSTTSAPWTMNANGNVTWSGTTTTTPPTSKNANGGYKFGVTSAPGAGVPSAPTTAAPTGTTNQNGGSSFFGAVNNSQSNPAPFKLSQFLNITFRHQDPEIADIEIPFLRHNTLAICRQVYMATAKLNASYVGTFRYAGFALRSEESLDKNTKFQAMNELILDVEPAGT